MEPLAEVLVRLASLILDVNENLGLLDIVTEGDAGGSP